MKLKHLVESQQFNVPLLNELFDRAKGMERVVARGGSLDYHHKIMASLFYRPSTRTRLSFEAAMHRLGGRVISTDQADAFSSEVGGERLEDTIKTISGYSDLIVLRSPEMGGAARAAEVSSVPVINAGDGSGGQHPTQALLDLYTIMRERGSLDGLTIAMIGELDQGRTVRSLAYLLSKFDRVKMYFVSPPEQRMKDDILAHLDEKKVWYSVETDMEKVVGEVDVVYLTQIRPGGLADTDHSGDYVVDSSILGSMKPDSMILHPLPRTQELDGTVDGDPRAMYFQQARNGLFVRMALLTILLDQD